MFIFRIANKNHKFHVKKNILNMEEFDLRTPLMDPEILGIFENVFYP